jgi:hypothetical protein
MLLELKLGNEILASRELNIPGTPAPAPVPTPTPPTPSSPPSPPAFGDAALFAKIIQESLGHGEPAVWGGPAITVTQTIDVKVGSNISGGGVIGPIVINSKITDGSPVMRVHVDSDNVNVVNFLLEKITIIGNGKEGNGLVVSIPTNNSWGYRSCLRDINVLNCGGDGIVVEGSFFESSIFNLWGNDNQGNGVVFKHLNNGQVSAWSWHGGGARKNGKAGIALLNGARDVKMFGLYLCENGQFGVNADQGCSMFGVGFENNKPSGLRFQNYAKLINCTFSTDGRQNPAISGYLAGRSLIQATENEDYGTPTRFAKIEGTGTVVLIAADSRIDAGPGVTLKTLA